MAYAKLLLSFVLISGSLTTLAQIGPVQGASCSNAVVIAGIPYNSPLLPKYKTCGNGNTYKPEHSCANTYTNGEDFLFKYTPDGASSCITLTLTTLNNNYPALFVFDGCPDDAGTNCVAQDINTEQTSAPLRNCEIKNLKLQPGQTYYIMATAMAGCHTFDLQVTAGACGPVPPGSGCGNPVNISSVPFYDANKSTCGMQEDLNRGNTKCGGAVYLDGPDYTYRFLSSEDRCARITVTSLDAYTGVFLYEKCPTDPASDCISYRLSPNPATMVINTFFEAGTEYYIVIGTDPAFSACTRFDLSLELIDDMGKTCDMPYVFPNSNYTFRNHTTRCKDDDYDLHAGCNTTGDNFMAGEETVYTFSGTQGECIGISLVCLDSKRKGGLYLMDKCPSDPTANCLQFRSKTFETYDNQISIEQTLPYTGTYYLVVGVPGDQSIDYNLTVASSTLDPTGKDCPNADILTIPCTRPNMSVACKGSDYSSGINCAVNYMRGNDYVFSFTAPKTACYKFTAANMDARGGLFLMNNCPNAPGARCLQTAVCEYAPCDSISFYHNLTAGTTYTLIVAGAEGITNMSFDLRVRELDGDDCKYCGADVCIKCNNVGFDRMDFTGWKGFTGNTTAPDLYTGIASGPVNNPESRHTIMSTGSYDPIAGRRLRTVSPYGGNFAVRLGNYRVGAEGEMLTYTYQVTEESKFFMYYYAVVFEDPSHPVTQQPYFRVRMFDVNGAVESEIICAHYEVRAAPNIPGFRPADNNNIAFWKDWTLVAVPLDLFIGHTVKIEFTTLDCTQRGHFGYAYIDAFCGDLEVLKSQDFLCKGGSVILTAPDGFAAYLWNTGETTRSIIVTQPGPYSVVVTSESDSLMAGCTATLATVIREMPLPDASFTFDSGCNKAEINYTDQSTSADTLPITEWKWHFGDGQTSDQQNPTHEYQEPGDYHVTLEVYNSVGCVDSIFLVVHIPEEAFIPPLNVPDTITVCERDKVQLYADSIRDVKYEWTGPAGFFSTQRTPVINNITLKQGGWYKVLATLKTDTCVKRRDSVFVEVIKYPEFKIRPDTSICFLEDSIPLWAKGGTSYLWSPAANFSNPALQAPIATISAHTNFQVWIYNEVCPDTLMDVDVTLLAPDSPLEIGPDAEICLGESFTLKADAKPNQYFVWTGPNAYTSKLTNPTVSKAALAHEGFYKIRAYLGPNQFCQFGEDSLFVKVNPLPEITIFPEQPNLCPGDSIQLYANGALTYSWFYADKKSFSTNPEISLKPASSLIVTVEGTDEKGCKNTADKEVKVKPKFKPDIGPDKSLCKGEKVYLLVNTSSFYKAPDNILWSTGETTPQIVVTQTGTYWVDVTVEGCSRRDSVKITFQDPDSFTLGPDTLLCEGSTLTLDLSEYGATVTWGDGSRNNKRNVTYPGGTYTVMIRNGACILKDEIVVKFQPKHTVDIGPDEVICLGKQVLVSSSQVSGSFLWKDGSITGTGPTFTVDAAGIHNVVLEHTLGPCKATDTKKITVEDPPVPDLGTAVTVCENMPVTLDPKIALPATFLWNDNTFAPVLVAVKAGIYWVRVKKGACEVTDTIEVVHDPIPKFSLGPDQVICEDDSALFDATVEGEATYLWNTGETTPRVIKSKPGGYTVIVTRGACTFTDDMNLAADLIPVFDLGPDQELCEGDVFELNTGISGATYLWNTGATTQSIDATDAGHYSVTVTRGKCSYSDDVDLVFHAPPQLDLGPPAVICEKQSFTAGTSLQADAYTWSTGATTPSITVSEAGDYYLTVKVGPCEVTDMFRLQVNAPPAVDLGPDRMVCEKIDTVISVAADGGLYLWNNGSTSPQMRITGEGLYYVTVVQGPCQATDTLLVKIQAPHKVILPPDAVLCTGEVMNIPAVTDASNPVYEWNTGESGSSIEVMQTGHYWVDVLQGVCRARDSVHAQFYDIPKVNLGPDLLLCEGTTMLLNAYSPGAQYIWSTGDTVPQISVSEAGSYWVRAYISKCEERDNVNLQFQDPPVVDLGPDIDLCPGERHLLQVNIPFASFYWSTGETSSSIIIDRTDDYSITVTQGPCEVTDVMHLTIHPLPPVHLKDTAICPEDSAFVDASCNGCSYLWRDGSTEPARWARPNSMLFVTITSEQGCILHTDVSIPLDRACWEEIFVPNTFTPNGDGDNDLFKVVYGNVKINDIFIFDRWGELLYHSNDPDQGWNGLYKGQVCKEDTYVWKVKYTNMYRVKKELIGHVNLLK